MYFNVFDLKDDVKNKTELCITMVPEEKNANKSDEQHVLGVVADWINTVDFLSGNNLRPLPRLKYQYM